MRKQMRIEVIVLVAGGMAVAGWAGIHFLSGKPSANPPAMQSPGATVAPGTMSAPMAAGASGNATMAIHSQEMSSRAVQAATGATSRATPVTTTTTPSAARAAQPVPAASVASDPRIETARKLAEEGKTFEARATLTALILAEPEGPAREEMRGALNGLNQTLFFSREPSSDCVFVEVNSPLAIIARQAGKDVYFCDLLMKINGITDPKRVRKGMKLKVPQGDFSAIVQKQTHRLVIFLNGAYIKEYAVTLGAPNSPTPQIAFKVANTKMVNPDWTSPDGHVYKFGDAKNILGTRWIGLEDPSGKHTGFGIHGTIDPASIGKDASNGCIRMKNEDAEEVFSMLMAGNKVEVTP